MVMDQSVTVYFIDGTCIYNRKNDVPLDLTNECKNMEEWMERLEPEWGAEKNALPTFREMTRGEASLNNRMAGRGAVL